MNILVIPYYQFYPLKTGASVAQFAIVEYLSTQCHISVLIPEKYTPTLSEVTELKARLPRVKIYTITNNTNNVVQKNQSKLRAIVSQAKTALKKRLKKQETIPLPLLSSEDELANIYTYNPYIIHSANYVEKMNSIIEQDNIDIVQLEFVENLSLVTAIPENIKNHIKTIYILHESRFARIKSHIKAKKINCLYGDYVYNFSKSLELSLMQKFNGILTFSQSDYLSTVEALGTHTNSIKVGTVPFPILDEDFRELDTYEYKPNKLTFVGPEQHFPNFDAMEWFIEQVATEIYQKLGLKLYIIGEWSQQTIKKYQHHPSQVKFLGFVDDLYAITKDSISVAPIRIGGGLRTKILQAMAQGIPVVATKFALDGINAKHEESVMIANDKQAFIEALNYLTNNHQQTLNIRKKAQTLIRNNYSQTVAAKQRYQFYQKTLDLII